MSQVVHTKLQKLIFQALLISSLFLERSLMSITLQLRSSLWRMSSTVFIRYFQPIRLLDPDCCYKITHLMANSADPDQLFVKLQKCLRYFTLQLKSSLWRMSSTVFIRYFQPIRLLDPDCCYKITHLMANSADPDQLFVCETTKMSQVVHTQLQKSILQTLLISSLFLERCLISITLQLKSSECPPQYL